MKLERLAWMLNAFNVETGLQLLFREPLVELGVLIL